MPLAQTSIGTCPSDTDLRQFTLGTGPPDAMNAFLEHLATCALCPDRMDQIWNSNTSQATSSSVQNAKEVNQLLSQTIFEKLDLDQLPPSDNTNAYGRLGRFDLMRVIGAGGMGIVFSAIDTRDDSTVAVKTLRFYQSKDRSQRERFLLEAHAMQRLVHPAFVPVLEIGEDGGIPFFVMPLLKGEDCANLIKRLGPLPIPMVVDIARQATAALDAIHANGLIHRDIKPSNLWMQILDTGKPLVTLLDFGLVCTNESDSSLTGTGVILGTPAYLSPEQTEGADAKVGPRSDLFSLGCVLYEAVTATPVFPGSTSLDILRNHIKFKITPPYRLRRDLPPRLERIIMELLERNPTRRTPNTSTLAKQLNNPNLLTIPLVSRRQAMWAGATVAATAALSASAWWLTRPKPETKMAPDLVIDVPGAVALATGQSWNDNILGKALIWADDSGKIFRTIAETNIVENWGNVTFPVQEIHICHNKSVAICGKNGQVFFAPWHSPNWAPGFTFVTKSKTIRHGMIMRTMKDIFFIIEDKTISSYNYKTGSSFTSGPRMKSNIIIAAEQPSTYNTIIALETGEIVGVNMPMQQLLQLKPIHTWMEITVTANPFLFTCHSDGNSIACLDTSGQITIRNFDNPTSAISCHQIKFKHQEFTLLNMLYKGNTNKIIAHLKTNNNAECYLIDHDKTNIPVQFECHSPLLAGQVEGNIWLLDSDERWKHYSIA